MSAKVKLTAKQEMFCKEYLVDLNATQAAIRAGYSEKTSKDMGCQNLAKPNINEYIAKLMQERTERVQIDADWVLLSAKKVFDRCMQQEDVTDRDGGSTGEWKFEHSGANKALEIIGKHVKVRAFEKEEKKEDRDTLITINLVDAKKPDAD